MLRRELGPVAVMGFARYRLVEGTKPAEFLQAAVNWQEQFLAKCDGIAMHCVLGNLDGEFADAILATDQKSFGLMAEAHPSHPASEPLMGMLDRDSIRLTGNQLLGGPKELPSGFSCIEFGTFRPSNGPGFSESGMMAVSDAIEQQYLARFSESRAHFMGKVDDGTYSEIAFVETSGAARKICGGYVGDETCQGLLNMFEPETVDLDFWHVLA